MHFSRWLSSGFCFLYSWKLFMGYCGVQGGVVFGFQKPVSEQIFCISWKISEGWGQRRTHKPVLSKWVSVRISTYHPRQQYSWSYNWTTKSNARQTDSGCRRSRVGVCCWKEHKTCPYCFSAGTQSTSQSLPKSKYHFAVVTTGRATNEA